MIGATAFFILIIALIIGTILGGGLTITTNLILSAKSRTDKMKLWLKGAGIGLIAWILILIFMNHSSPGGPPTEEDYNNLFRLFAMVGLTPGFLFLTGSLGQMVGLISGVKKPIFY